MDETTVTPAAKPQVPTFGRRRFSPGAYTLDLSTVLEVPIKVNSEPSTFGKVYCRLRDSKIEEMPPLVFSEKYVTGEGVIQLDCRWPLQATMHTLIELTRQGIDPHGVTWFYYDHDWSRDADERYSFFAVYGGKIVMERCSFSSEAPLILKQEAADDEPIWHSHRSFDEAWERYWYRKFYSETVTGQLMVLRPDEPILYHYERPQPRDSVREVREVLSDAGKMLTSAIWIVFFVFLIVSWPGSSMDRWTDKAWYSFRYNADLKNVRVEKRPLDCDFFHAPVGGKGCHYKKQATIFGDEQRRELIQRASTMEERKAYQEQPNSVAIYWEKDEQ
jgi:hypothetical protein